MKIIVVIFVLFEKEEKKDMTTCKVHILYKEMMFILRVSLQI